jgi:hypothetical protein
MTDDSRTENEDDESLSRWWTPHVGVYRRRKLEPFHPTRLKDGANATKVVSLLEDRWDVDIVFRVVNPQDGTEWSILVDGTEVGTVEHVRRKKGLTRYDITKDRLTSLVEDALKSR